MFAHILGTVEDRYRKCISEVVRIANIIIFNPFTPELKKCILPTFQKAIV